ncbi:LytR C-terminal domain-containing protein [Cellulomonas marina]|uniref:LytR cell envelope-related transcriptional attenuator n=1 Tax=Cellulomonas marina TaxID=988821 RepID=A0A1I1A6I1_9CELL|nr:LytR C-terminal domain-containing protein [Cellulomonas marina]GIG29596.1 hypothetical protein Cma02nite_21960 [Cellulomonas marina]SFB33581.1 LytR cell envelope-related transcriptional attenuator [Cellulomonas marina]
MSTPERARQLRRRHMHERQAAIFGVLVAALAVAGLGSAAVYTGTVTLGWLDRPFSTPTPSASAVAAVYCPPAGALPVPYGQVTVNVYNGTGRTGLAATTAQELTARGFVVATTGNSDTVTNAARITYGAAGSAAAYTLAAQLDGESMVLDARADGTVDLALGREFEALADPATIVLDPAVPLVGPEGCVPLEQALVGPTPAPTPAPTA